MIALGRLFISGLVAGTTMVMAASCASDDGTTTSGRGLGTGNPDAATAFGSPQGSCDPNFCPSVGSGTPCCVAANGPCGVDNGTGCVSAAAGGDGG